MGGIYTYSGQDPNYWSYFKARDLIKGIDLEFGVKVVKIWWKHDGGSLDKDVKSFGDNGDSSELTMFRFRNNCEVGIFTEPKPITGYATFVDKVREKGNGKKCDEEVDNSSEYGGDSSNEFVKGVHFNDSEQEMMKGFDEGVDGEP